MSATQSNEYKGTSFHKPEDIKPRLIMSLTGLEKAGKTHFALTAPGPIAYMSTDLGDEGVVQKFTVPGKNIMVAEYEIPELRKGNEEKVRAACDRIWDQLIDDYEFALKRFRTLVFDTATEIWELLRLARFGKLEQVKPHHYVQTNREYREFIRQAYSSHCNLILIHKLKAVWEDRADGQGGTKARKTGKYERAGFTDTGYLVQVNANVIRVPRQEREDSDDGFRLEIVDCRQNAALAGEILSTPMNTFPMLAQMVFPDSSSSDWE